MITPFPRRLRKTISDKTDGVESVKEVTAR
jgi:hypothetical protein